MSARRYLFYAVHKMPYRLGSIGVAIPEFGQSDLVISHRPADIIYFFDLIHIFLRPECRRFRHRNLMGIRQGQGPDLVPMRLYGLHIVRSGLLPRTWLVVRGETGKGPGMNVMIRTCPLQDPGGHLLTKKNGAVIDFFRCRPLMQLGFDGIPGSLG